MGHADVDTTLNVYAQVVDGSPRAAAEKAGSELFEIVQNGRAASERARSLIEMMVRPARLERATPGS